MIVAKDDLVREEVFIEEWGGSVYVRVMMGHEKDEMESRQLATEGQPPENRLKTLRALLAVLTTCDETGASLFMLTDVPVLQQKSATALEKIFDVALRLNRMRADEVQELVGESNAVQSDDSGSGSPSPSV
jgi:hypothetical protein